MKALVTGGFGYLGSSIAESLKSEDFEVRLLARRLPDYMVDWARDFDVQLGDVKDSDSLDGCCKDVDVVIHTAAANEIVCSKDEREALLVNGLGTSNIVKETASAGVDRFVYFSTFHIYGPGPGQTISETTSPKPVHSYGLTHLVGELYTEMAALKNPSLTATSLRISNGYGAPVRKEIPRWTLVINDLCRLAHQDGKIIIKSSGKQSRDFVAISDIYQALKLVLARKDDRYEVFNVGGENTKTILQIAQAVKTVFARRYQREIPIEIKGEDEPAVPPVVFNIDKIKGVGFQPSDMIEREIDKILTILET